MDTTRRNMLKTALLGSGFIGLRSMATGIPAAVLLSGKIPEAHAEDFSSEPQSLILFTSQRGDPFNANVPGCYTGVDGVHNNPHPQMAPTDLMLGDYSTRAARPWSEAPQAVLDRTTFIHHRTYLNTHPGYTKVLGLVGSAKAPGGNGSDMVASVYSSELAEALGTIQQEPISLTTRSELSFQGRALQSLRPSMLRQIFAPRADLQLQLQQLRDQTLDDLHEQLRDGGTHAQKVWLDRHALSRDQVRSIDESLLERFTTLDNDSADNQIRAAITLILMKVSPVIAIEIPFGGDNHGDNDLSQERDETVSGVASWRLIFEELTAAGLQDQVTVANLNVFGRTLRNQGNNKGRDHNLNHHVMSITGKHIRGSVAGGIEPSGNDYGATSIDSVTGASGGDIPVEETLEAAAHTLGRALGIAQDRLDERIANGTPILSSLAGA
ncbi:MAG: DUF1501 domain-containing protein [Myxococcota bacterium]